MNKLRGDKNASLAAAKAELGRLAEQREKLIQAIKDGVPGAEVKDDLARIRARRKELEGLLLGKDEPVLLHAWMAAHYRVQVATLWKSWITRKARRKSPGSFERSLRRSS